MDGALRRRSRCCRSAAEGPLQQPTRASAGPGLQLARDSAEQACQRCSPCGERVEEHHGRSLLPGNGWLTDLKQERFAFCLRPSHGRVNGLPLLGNGAPAVGECSARRLTRASLLAAGAVGGGCQLNNGLAGGRRGSLPAISSRRC